MWAHVLMYTLEVFAVCSRAWLGVTNFERRLASLVANECLWPSDDGITTLFLAGCAVFVEQVIGLIGKKRI